MDRYEQLREIGHNHYATIWEGHDFQTERSVAIMQIHSQFLQDERRRERIWRDVKSLSKVKDKSIVPVHDILEDNGWVVMELMKGHLGSRLTEGPITPDLARSVLRQVLEALREIHKAGYCHGDIKPHNMLYNREGKILLSFSPGLFLGGTVPYRQEDQKYQAPELLKTDTFGEVGPPVDLYCLGFSVLESLKGPGFDSLFKGTKTDPKTAWTRWHGDPNQHLPAAASVVPDLPQDLSIVLDRMLQKMVRDRYENADQVLADLDDAPLQLVDVEPDESTSSSRRRGSSGPAVRHEGGQPTRRSEEPKQKPTQRSRKSRPRRAEDAKSGHGPRKGKSPSQHKPWSYEWMNEKLENPYVMTAVIVAIVILTLVMLYSMSGPGRGTDRVAVRIVSEPVGAEWTISQMKDDKLVPVQLEEPKTDEEEPDAPANSTPSEIELSLGEYRIHLEKEGYESFEEEFTVKASKKPLSLEFELQKSDSPGNGASGSTAAAGGGQATKQDAMRLVHVESRPGASLAVIQLKEDGSRVELKDSYTTPADFDLAPGRYEFLLKKKGFEDRRTDPVEVAPSKETLRLGPYQLIEARPSQHVVAIKVEAREGAEPQVSVNGKPLQQAPDGNFKLDLPMVADATGSTTLHIVASAPGHMPFDKEISRSDLLTVTEYPIQLSPAMGPNVSKLCEQGFAHLGAGELNDAERAFDKAVQQDPDFALAFRGRGQTRHAHGDLAQAVTDLKKAAALDSSDPLTFLYLGHALADSGQFASAVDAYSTCIDLGTEEVTAFTGRALALYAVGEYQRAVDDCGRALELVSNYAPAFNTRARANEQLGKVQQAIEDYRKAIELAPEYPDAYFNRGRLLWRTAGKAGKNSVASFDQAVEDFSRVIQLRPNMAEAYNGRGLVYSDTARHKEAVADFDKVISLNPNLVEAYRNRSRAHRALGNSSQAEADLQKAQEIEKAQPETPNKIPGPHDDAPEPTDDEQKRSRPKLLEDQRKDALAIRGNPFAAT